MINRELIRLKVIQLVYAFYQNEGKTIEMAEKELMFSFGKAYDLYKYLLTLLVDLRNLAERKDASLLARQKRLGVQVEGPNPDGILAHNKLLRQLAENKELIEYREKQKSDWIEEESFIKKLYTAFSDSEVFQFYMEKEDFSYAADRELIRKLYKTYICNNEDFDDFLEDHSLYWNDDKEIVDSFVLKTIKRFQEGSTEEQPLLPEFASDDDRQYALTLFRTTLEQGEEMRQLIKENCKNWEFKRLAFMDVIITQIALTEILTFPSIPLGVTFNEYLDIAKFYSTPRSSSYINGLLNGIVRTLKENGTIMK
jgi:N utilization substance protein B